MKKISPYLFEAQNALLITIGSSLLAVGVCFFLLPLSIATGGTPGMSIILHYTTGVSVGLAMLMINIPLTIAGIKFIDVRFVARTIYSIVLTSIFVESFPLLIKFSTIESLLLSTIYGGVFVGAGVGLVMKGHASAGGTTIIAKIVSSYSTIKPAQAVLFFDMLIVITIGIIFNDTELALWSLLSIYVTSRLIDKILTGVVSEKIVHIVSNKPNKVSEVISTKLGRDTVSLSGLNLIAHENKNVLIAVVGTREIQRLKDIVLAKDKEATIIIMEASEMTGSSVRH